MNKDYITLKNTYGEHFAKLSRELFPTILETEGLLSSIITSKFAPTHNLYDDIIKGGKYNFKNYIYSFINKTTPQIETNKTVRELLSDAGYDFYECHTEQDINKFKKYYALTEKLCTFNGGRLENCYVFWAVKKDVDKIHRKDYKKPQRQDKYGTSVISIQFTKIGHTLSIKNRYNHRVLNPDATFSNNLDNITVGLTNAFEKEYNLKINQNTNYLELPEYTLANDGRFYKYNYEINNIYYCPNNIIIDNGRVIKLDKSRYILVDYFIIDKVNKKIYYYDINIIDSFISNININPNNKIIIKETKTKKERTITINNYPNKEIIIKTDNNNRMIYYMNPNIEKIYNYFLYKNIYLEELIIPNVKTIMNYCLTDNKNLKRIDITRVETIEDSFLPKNKDLQEISMPNLQFIGIDFLSCNSSLERINIPKLKNKENIIYIRKNIKENQINRIKTRILKRIGGLT